MAPSTPSWGGRPQAEADHQRDLDLARMQDSDWKEENEALLQSLQEELSKVKDNNNPCLLVTHDETDKMISNEKPIDLNTFMK